MLKPERRPTSPGEILREHYLKPRQLSVAALARAVEHSYKHMSQVVNGKAAIEAKLASKLAAVKFAVEAGIETHIAHGRHPERLAGIVAGNGISTRFHPGS